MEKKYVLKVVRHDMTTRNHFKWGNVGDITVAPDWDPNPKCGGGLHGWLSGVGDIRCQDISESDGARWLVIEVEGEVVSLGGKVKFERGKTVFAGDMREAAAIVADLSGEQGSVIGIIRSGGDRSTVLGGCHSTLTGGNYSAVSGGDHSIVTGGDLSIVTGGEHSKVSGGDQSTVSGGYHSIVTGGDQSTVSGGDRSIVTGGDLSTVSGGNHSIVTGMDRSIVNGGNYSTVRGGAGSTVTGGVGSTLTGGKYSKVTGGNFSTLMGGEFSTLTGGEFSTVKGDNWSVLQLLYWDGRKRLVIAYVGEDGIKPNTPYRLNNDHQFEEVVTSEK